VVSVDRRRIGDGKPGATTKRLLEAFRALRTTDGTRVDYDARPAAVGKA